MSKRLFLLGLTLLFAGSLPTGAQPPVGPAPRPLLPPLLFVKIDGPKGMRFTVYPGSLSGRTYEAPAVLGLRPGYCYRVAFSDVPEFPKETFFATLEVRVSLILDNTLKNADFPATLTFTAEDFRKTEANVAIEKAILLERADHALPITSSKDVPLEVTVPPNRDLLRETRHLGQPMLVMHMGERKLEPVEMISVPGTILLPGTTALGLPALPPCVPWSCLPTADPVHGPMTSSDMFGLPDGGDVGLRAGITGSGRLVGIDATDTVAGYTDSRGRKRIAVSNRVVLCVPRFILARGEITPSGHSTSVGLGKTRATIGETVASARYGTESRLTATGVEAFNSKIRPSGTQTEIGLAISGEVKGVKVNVVTQAPSGVDAICPKAVESEKEGPLQVIKWPDKCGANIGDIITFFVRYTNTGGLPMSGIVVADSLHTRYEYVPGSAKTDRASTFTTEANEAGSLILRWQIQGELGPREQGIVSFQVRVR